VAESLKADLEAAGLKIKFDIVEALQVNAQVYGGQWTGLFNATQPAYGTDGEIYIQAGVSGGGRNFSGVKDAKLDQLIKQTREKTVAEERWKVFQQIEEYANWQNLLMGTVLPYPFAYGSWKKFLHNTIESSSWWMNGGNMVHSCEWWLDEKAPMRNIASL